MQSLAEQIQEIADKAGINININDRIKTQAAEYAEQTIDLMQQLEPLLLGKNRRVVTVALFTILAEGYASIRNSSTHTLQDSIDLFRHDVPEIEKYIKLAFSSYS